MQAAVCAWQHDDCTRSSFAELESHFHSFESGICVVICTGGNGCVYKSFETNCFELKVKLIKIDREVQYKKYMGCFLGENTDQDLIIHHDIIIHSQHTQGATQTLTIYFMYPIVHVSFNALEWQLHLNQSHYLTI